MGQGFFFGHAVGFVERAQDGFHGERAVLGDGGCYLFGFGERAAFGHDMADESYLQCLLSGDVLAGEKDVGGVRVRDLTAQTHGRAAHRIERPASFRHAELGAFPGYSDVHSLENLGAACDGHAFNGGDDGLGGAIVAQEGFVCEVWVFGHALLQLFGGEAGVGVAFHAAHGFEVGAGAEVAARAGDDDASGVVVLRCFAVGVQHSDEHCARQGIQAFRAVHRDYHHAFFTLYDCVRLYGCAVFV